jgi:cytochrome P450
VTQTTEALGALYDPLGAHLDDPYPSYTRARRQTPIFFSPTLNAWVVTRIADVRKVLRDGKTFSSANTLRPFAPLHPQVYQILDEGYPLAESLITSDGEKHRRQRMAQTGFLPERVAAAEPYIVERATALVDGFAADGHAEFMTAFAHPLPVSVICHIVGFDAADHQLLGDDTRAAAALSMGHRFGSDQEQLDAAHRWVRSQRTIGRYVRDCRAAPRADVMSELISALAPGDGPLTAAQEADLVRKIFGITLPGHITTSALLGNGLMHLLRDPGQWRLLCERPDLIPNAVEEMARFDTPTHIFLRLTTKDTTVAGQRLPAGAEVALWLAAANRDEDAFERAEEFDVTRRPRPHVVFGLGAHFCLGAALARKQIEAALRVLTGRLPGLRLVPDQEITFRPTLDHRGPMSLHVTWS